jgi:hypothetical protein
MENFTDGGTRAGMWHARAHGVRAAGGGAGTLEGTGAITVPGPGLGHACAPVPAPSRPLNGGTATVAAGGGTGTVTGPAGSRPGVPPSSGASEPVALVPVPPSQPHPPPGGRWPLHSHMAYGPLPGTVPTARSRTKAVLLEWGTAPGDWAGGASRPGMRREQRGV